MTGNLPPPDLQHVEEGVVQALRRPLRSSVLIDACLIERSASVEAHARIPCTVEHGRSRRIREPGNRAPGRACACGRAASRVRASPPVASGNREACAKYKRALDKLLPPEWSEAVYTENAADVIDRPLVAELQLSPEREDDVRLLFKKPNEDPKILIVTDKLLTGYDVPLLYCMYLDKPMRDHVLLQAIARVNRTYVDTNDVQKRVGLVVDFVGVLRELKKALQFVNGGGIMHHAERSGGPVAAAQNCATHGPLLVVARGRRCTAWSSMRRFDWRLSTRG